MGRGGKRDNAGRPPLVGELAKMAIGARCEALWEEEWDAARAQKSKTETKGLADLWEEAHNVPIDQRPSWINSQRGEDFKDDIDFALREKQGTGDAAEPSRILQVGVPRPKGQRGNIIERVALEETSNRGQTLSPRFVESCWKDFRKLKQRLNT